MTISIREQVIAAVAERLATISTISGLTVERIRARPVTPAKMPRLVVMEGTQSKIDEVDGLKIMEAIVPILGFVAASRDTAIGTAANDLYAASVAILEAAGKNLAVGSPPAPPDGSVLWAGEGDLGIEFDEEEGHAPSAVFTLTWKIQYQVSDTDPYSAAS